MDNQPINSSNSRQYLIDTILASSNKKATEILISVIFRPLPQGQNQLNKDDIYKRTHFFMECIYNHADEFALKLSYIVQSSTETPFIRNIFVVLLYSLFSFQESSSFQVISPLTCNELKPVLLLLLQQETSLPVFNTLSRIISILVSQMFQLNNFNPDWTELLDYIGYLLVVNVKRGLWVLRDLPVNMNGPDFTDGYVLPLFRFFIFSHLRNTSSDDEELWVLAFGASFTLGLLLISCQSSDLVPSVIDLILNSMAELLSSGKEVYIRKGFQSIDHILDNQSWRYSIAQAVFVHYVADNVCNFHDLTDETVMVVDRFTCVFI